MVHTARTSSRRFAHRRVGQSPRKTAHARRLRLLGGEPQRRHFGAQEKPKARAPEDGRTPSRRAPPAHTTAPARGHRARARQTRERNACHSGGERGRRGKPRTGGSARRRGRRRRPHDFRFGASSGPARHRRNACRDIVAHSVAAVPGTRVGRDERRSVRRGRRRGRKRRRSVRRARDGSRRRHALVRDHPRGRSARVSARHFRRARARRRSWRVARARSVARKLRRVPP
mmetsp:Transcript_10119/g.42558  ORF Transcript_10119/g.42558 Transcript_10119/m.42558 type:complete len:230 (+) Transcript_10119:253-942(+)